MQKNFKYETEIKSSGPGGGAYIVFPYDIKQLFGRGRVKVSATFDGYHYRGSIVNMGVKNNDGSVCYILGIRKDIRKSINKDIGDKVVMQIEIVENN